MVADSGPWDTACHEAAHAVVGHMAGGLVLRVSLDESRTNIAWHIVGSRSQRPALERGRVLSLLAGYIAGLLTEPAIAARPELAVAVVAEVARRHLHDPEPDPRIDQSLAARLVRSFFPHDQQAAEQYLNDAAMEAGQLVQQYRAYLVAVAEALVERGELSGADFRQIMASRGIQP